MNHNWENASLGSSSKGYGIFHKVWFRNFKVSVVYKKNQIHKTEACLQGWQRPWISTTQLRCHTSSQIAGKPCNCCCIPLPQRNTNTAANPAIYHHNPLSSPTPDTSSTSHHTTHYLQPPNTLQHAPIPGRAAKFCVAPCSTFVWVTV